MSGGRWGFAGLMLCIGVVGCLGGGDSQKRTELDDFESDPAKEPECDSEFVCEAGKECADCDCPCPGLFQLWSRQLSFDNLHTLAPGPDSETYFLLNQDPWLLGISKDGEDLPVGDYDLSWTVDVPVVMGVDAERNLLLAGVVSPLGEDDIHIERVSPNGNVLSSDTVSVEQDDSLMAGRMLDDGTFVLVGRHFIATISNDDEWDVAVSGESIDGDAAAVGEQWVLLQDSTSQLVSMNGAATATRSFSDTRTRYCAPTIGVDDDVYELCTDISAGVIQVEVSALDHRLERVWTASQQYSSGQVNASVAAIAGGSLFSTTRDGTQRLDALGDVIAWADGSGVFVALSETDTLSLPFSGSTIGRWYAPPTQRPLREAGQSCSQHDDCESSLCCRTTAGALGVCTEGSGCTEGALCNESSECEGICDSEIAGTEEPRCRRTCENSDECGDGAHCVQVDCVGEQSCAQICVDDCLARGDTDCDPASRCEELDSGSFACLPACMGVECGQVDTIQCGRCAEGAYCLDNVCVGGRCYGWECGVDDGLACGSCAEGEYCNTSHLCQAACQGIECGDDHGVECGTCDGDEVCVEGSCTLPCAGMECGEQEGVSCGECDDREFCEQGQCQAACVDIQCGEDNGFDCGQCADDEYCEAGRCQAACVGMDCGQDNGISCGECGDDEYCDTDNTCVVACASMECGFDDVFECGTCPEGQACDRGQCVTATCDPAVSSYCDGQSIYECIDGLESEFLESCALSDHCVADGVRARCEHDTCLAYSPLCEDVILGTCNAEGSGLDLAEPQTDCSEQGLDCSRAGCGDVTLDRVGFPSQTGVDVSTVTYWMVGNFYEVTSTTTLVEFRPDLDLADWELRWHIYRSETREGPYSSTQNIREVQGGSNSGLIETVPYFNFQLEAGYYYFIGVEAVDRALPAIVRYDDTAAIADVSFGTVLGGYFGPQEGSLEFTPTSYLATQELTTAILAP